MTKSNKIEKIIFCVMCPLKPNFSTHEKHYPRSEIPLPSNGFYGFSRPTVVRDSSVV